MLVVGPNGAGKTNLLESLHLGTQGFSPRTRNDAQVIRFGETAGRVALEGSRGSAELALEVTLEAGRGKRAKLNGGALRAAEQLRGEVSTLVFTPDRLAVVKAAPAVRRAYVDRALRTAVSCAGGAVRRVRRRGRSAQRGPAARGRRAVVGATSSSRGRSRS